MKFRKIQARTRIDNRIKSYKTVALPICIYVSENWVLKKRDEQRIQTTGIRATANVPS